MGGRNSEGPPNITVQEPAGAAWKAKGYCPLVYICSPFAGDTGRNVRRAQGYCRFAVSKGCIPLAPHLHYPQFMDDSDQNERELGLFFALALLGRCDELWVFGSRLSAGMAGEISKAKQTTMPIRYFSDKCEEVQEP